MEQAYVCPQCGPDPRGADVHAQERHEWAADVKRSALDRFNECGGTEEASPLERLRFFCSLAMNGQDWLDVEPFFDAIAISLAPTRAANTEE